MYPNLRLGLSVRRCKSNAFRPRPQRMEMTEEQLQNQRRYRQHRQRLNQIRRRFFREKAIHNQPGSLNASRRLENEIRIFSQQSKRPWNEAIKSILKEMIQLLNNILVNQKFIEDMFDIEQPNIEEINTAYTRMDQYNVNLEKKRREYENAKELMF